MEGTAIDKEKRRQHIERRKRRRRKLMLQRIVVLGIGLFIVIGAVKGISSLLKGKAESKTADAIVSGKSETSNKQPDASQAAITANKTVAMTIEDIEKGSLILVNDTHPLREYDKLQLENVVANNEGLYRVKSKDTMLQAEALKAFNLLIKDFTTQKGDNNIGMVSGYRNYTDQERLHYEAVTEKKNEDTDILVAKPDRSEHHTGLAIDLGLYYADGSSGEYDGKDIYSWINENCYKYGFIVRYTDDKKEKTGIGNEPWHLRYVGVVHATIMKDLNLCLEEYIEYIKTYRYYTNPFQSEEESIKNYSVYYVPASGEITNVPVPEKKAYTISGNNKDGFIVTVDLNK